MALQWFCVASKPAQEKRAYDELTKQNFKAYLPLFDDEPYFKGYLFLRMDRERDPWGKVRNTRGCQDFVRCGLLPSPLRDDIMDMIQNRPTATQKPVEAETNFTKGQRVIITDGFLKGWEALYSEDRHARTRCLLSILGNEVEIDRKDIRAA